MTQPFYSWVHVQGKQSKAVQECSVQYFHNRQKEKQPKSHRLMNELIKYGLKQKSISLLSHSHSTELWHHLGFPCVPSSSLIPPACLTIYLSSDIVCLTWRLIPQVGVQSHKAACPLSKCQLYVEGCHLHFWLTGYKLGVPVTPSLCSINLLRVTHRTQGSTHIYQLRIMNNIRPDSDEPAEGGWCGGELVSAFSDYLAGQKLSKLCPTLLGF